VRSSPRKCRPCRLVCPQKKILKLAPLAVRPAVVTPSLRIATKHRRNNDQKLLNSNDLRLSNHGDIKNQNAKRYHFVSLKTCTKCPAKTHTNK
jgi:hypothetical protein